MRTNALDAPDTHTQSAGAGRRAAIVAWLAVAAVGLTGCAEGDGDTNVERAQARVTAKERAVAKAESGVPTAAAERSAEQARTYVVAVDRYGDVLNATAPTVGRREGRRALTLRRRARMPGRGRDGS